MYIVVQFTSLSGTLVSRPILGGWWNQHVAIVTEVVEAAEVGDDGADVVLIRAVVTRQQAGPCNTIISGAVVYLGLECGGRSMWYLRSPLPHHPADILTSSTSQQHVHILTSCQHPHPPPPATSHHQLPD